ncbi:hypothetical protein SeLEV6574_g01217 [Synchytrium endobioticum]|uniref:Nuclear pore complex protein n=1 Tax=Synchytrium endobioticum TaxID=286115 RepID=A0A507DE29_9FUNG|nr:hypothetical protein SeLEV6574_g01217 [Synchytrium endobioticum]
MSKYLIIVLLLLALLHHGFADPEDTDAILKQQTEALRREKWAFRKSSIREKREKKLLSEVSRRLQNSPNEDPAVLISLVVQYIVDVGFTKDHVEPPHAGMSQAELEFRWEALDLADYLLPGGYSEYCNGLKGQYRQELTTRMADATFGSARALEYPADQIDWPSAIFLMVSEVQRGSKALESLKASNESPVSSFTEADVLLHCVGSDWPRSESSGIHGAYELYGKSKRSKSVEHLVYRIHYLEMRIQRSRYIVEACSKFLQQRHKNRSIQEMFWMDREQQEQGLINEINGGIAAYKDRAEIHTSKISDCMKKLFNYVVNMPWDFEALIQHVTDEIIKVKEEMPANDYEAGEATAKLEAILDDHPLGFLQDTGVPSNVISFFGLVTPVESYFPQLQASPYMGLAAEYHLLLLWRCMQRLSLLKWFKNFYDFELLDVPEDTVQRVNEVDDTISAFARHVLEMFDFYENTAQPRIFRMSEQERKLARELLNLDDIHLASTWEKIIGANAAKYIVAADQAEKKIKNSGSWSPIQQVDEIPLRVNSLIQAFPVPNNLEGSCLYLAAMLHDLAVQRARKALLQCPNSDILPELLRRREALFEAYNNAAKIVGVRPQPGLKDLFYMTELDNTVASLEAVRLHSGYTGAHEGIYNPGTTNRRAGLGIGSSALLEGSSSSSSSLNRDASGDRLPAGRKGWRKRLGL